MKAPKKRNKNLLQQLMLIFFIFIITIISTNVTFARTDEPKEIIVFIPGMMGSELFEDEDKEDLVWFDVKDYDEIEMDENDELTPGVPLGWRGSKTSSNFGLDFYKDIEDKFKRYFKVEYFAYDWRLSNEESAKKLKYKIDEILAKKENEDLEKVNILAHSMGGLIAKKYILDTRGEKVDKFISVGTPFFGAPSAFWNLYWGFDAPWPKLKLISADEVQQIPAVYETLPNKAYFNNNKTGYIVNYDGENFDMIKSYDKTRDIVTKEFDKDLYEAAETFHQKLDKQIASYLGNRFYRIIGDSRSTIGALIAEKVNNGRKYRYSTTDLNGDGVVPILGAAPAKNKTFYADLRHEYMLYDGYDDDKRDVLEAIEDILRNNNVHLRTKYKGNDDLKFSIYNLKSTINIATKNSSNSGSVVGSFSSTLEEDDLFEIDNSNYLNPTLSLEFKDGSKFIMQNGEILNKNPKVDVRNLGSTIELITPPEEVLLKVEKSNDNNDSIGIIASKNEDGVNTLRMDYQGLSFDGGIIVGKFNQDLQSNQVGIDTNLDDVADHVIDALRLNPVNINAEISYYDEVTPYEPVNGDDEDNSEPGDNPGDGSVTINISATNGKNDWKTSNVSITIDTSVELPNESDQDSNGASLETDQKPEISYKIDEGSESSYSGAISYSEDGKHLITAYVKDHEGKILGQASKTFKIDQTNPELQTQVAGVRGENGWIVSNAQVSIGASDETSKLARVDVDLDGSGFSSYDAPIDVKEEGSHTVASEVEDNAGNTESDSASFKIDKTKPVISNVFLQDEYYWDQDFPIQFNVSDTVSGVASVKATINGKPVTNGSMYHFTEPGWHTYQIEVKDEAGWKAVYETKFEVYIPARITFEPKNLQLDHGNGMATNHIELPAPFEPEKINFSTIQTNDSVVHVQDPKYGYVKNPISDSDDNGIRDMMQKYERESLVNVIAPQATGSKWSDGDITIFGEWDSYHFKGYDHIEVLNSGYTPPPPDVTPPIETSVPSDGAHNVSVDVTPIINFSEKIILNSGEELSDDAAQGIVELKNSLGQSIPFTANWIKNTLSFQINPTKQLEGLGTYTLSVKPETVTDSVYNSNEPLAVSFKTENHSIVIESPLPVPQVEVDDDSGYPIPDPVTTPTPTPQPSPTPIPTPPVSSTPTEEQFYDNQEASRLIAAAEDRETVVDEVEKSLNRIRDYINLNNQSITDKLNVINNSVDTVMVALADKSKQGTVKQKDVEDYLKMLLQDIFEKVLTDEALNNIEEIDQAVSVMSNLSRKAIRDLNEIKDIKKDVKESINLLLSKENFMAVENGSHISELGDRVVQLASHVERLNDSLGDHSSEIDIEKRLDIEVDSDSKAEITILARALRDIESTGVSIGIITEDKAGMHLPPGLFKELGDQDIHVSLTKVESRKKSKAVNDSDVYEFTLVAGDQEITEFGDEEVTLAIPYKDKMINPQAYYYDEKKKQWLMVKSRDGKVADVEKANNIAVFDTPHFTKFRVSDSPISKITVQPSKTQLEPGAELQLTVTAVSNKKSIDITEAESGTIYSSSQPDIVSIDENGLIKVAKEAQEGKKVTITVKNAGKSSKVMVYVALKKVSSLTVTPKKMSLEPSASERLTVTAKMSDGSSNDVTTSSLGTTYKSSNENIATVDENGIVTIQEEARKGEKVTITVSNSKKTAKCTITVK